MSAQRRLPCDACGDLGAGRAPDPDCSVCHGGGWSPPSATLAVSDDSTPIGHVEPDGRFVPAITDRERACLRGDHEPVAIGNVRAFVCTHCRCAYVPRSA